MLLHRQIPLFLFYIVDETLQNQHDTVVEDSCGKTTFDGTKLGYTYTRLTSTTTVEMDVGADKAVT